MRALANWMKNKAYALCIGNDCCDQWSVNDCYKLVVNGHHRGC